MTANLPCVFCLALCFTGITAAKASEPAPDAAAQNDMLERIGSYAAQYVDRLPNFVCEQVVSQFQAGRRAKHWRKGDTLTSKLMYNEGREERTLVLVNDQPVRLATRRWRAPLTTEGEFGMLLGTIFATSSNASFEWSHWENMHGKQLAVFDYSIDKQHSTLRLSLSDLAKAIVPYHGSIYGDPESGEIWRISNTISDIPAAIHTKNTTTTIDYDEVEIGDKRYLLPVHAAVVMTTDIDHIRNDIDFTGYRKFEADSSITYTSDPNSPPKP